MRWECIQEIKQTLEQEKKRHDAIRLRRERGWDERQIGMEIGVAKSTVHVWLAGQANHRIVGQYARLPSNGKAGLPNNQVHILDATIGINRLPHESVDLFFTELPYNIGVKYGVERWSWCTTWPEIGGANGP